MIQEGFQLAWDMADGKQTEVYDWAALKEKDKYKVFFGGNYGEVVIHGGCRNGKTLLILKDSFANSFAPLLVSQYETIVMERDYLLFFG